MKNRVSRKPVRHPTANRIPKLGEDFEKAVYAFTRTLDPDAQVIFNHHVPDRDTGTLRQCDVWINARIGGHWPIAILVSCKDHATKLDVGDIGTFCNEIYSTRANMGVIYSREGFTQHALEKARSNRTSCCRLYQDEPADIPQAVFIEQFTCTPIHTIALDTDLSGSSLRTWNDVFDLPEGDKFVIDAIGEAVAKSEEDSLPEPKEQDAFPHDWELTLRFHKEAKRPEIKLRVICHWRRFHARLEANLLNGSYCLTNGSFRGGVYGPSIDTQSSHPGKGWQEITEGDYPLPANRAILIPYVGNSKDALRSGLGPTELPIPLKSKA